MKILSSTIEAEELEAYTCTTNRAAHHLSEFLSVDAPPPAVTIDRGGQDFAPRYERDKGILLPSKIMQRLSLGQIIATIGEEVTHYLHDRERPYLVDRRDDLTTQLVKKGHNPALAEERGLLYNYIEAVGLYGGLVATEVSLGRISAGMTRARIQQLTNNRLEMLQQGKIPHEDLDGVLTHAFGYGIALALYKRFKGSKFLELFKLEAGEFPRYAKAQLPRIVKL